MSNKIAEAAHFRRLFIETCERHKDMSVEEISGRIESLQDTMKDLRIAVQALQALRAEKRKG